MSYSLSDIRRLYDIHDILGLNYRKKTMVCPLPQHSHASNTASFSIYTARDGIQRFKCHGHCGLQGDVIDLAGYLWVRDYDGSGAKSIQDAVRALETRGSIYIPTSETKPTNIHPMKWAEYLPIGNAAKEYARSRGLNNETIEKFRLGQDLPYLTIPSFVDGRLMGIKKRNITSNGLRFISDDGSRQSLFNQDKIEYKDLIFLVKGEIPAMLMDQMGYSTCAPTGGEGGWDNSWNTFFSVARTVVIGDNDEVGIKFFGQRAIDLNAKLVFPPSHYKDLDEWILAKPEASIRAIERWAND